MGIGFCFVSITGAIGADCRFVIGGGRGHVWRTISTYRSIRPILCSALHRAVHAFPNKGGNIMTAENTTKRFGWRVYGLGVIALGAVCLALGFFHPGQPVPKDFPGRTVLAYAAAFFMLVAGAAVEWRRTRHWAAA